MGVFVESIESDFRSLVSGIPGPVPIEYLHGLLFEGLDPLDEKVVGAKYSESEIRMLFDVAEREIRALSRLPAFRHPVWIGSAGGPGAGKTTALFQYVAELFGIEISKQEWLEPSLQTATQKIFSSIPVALVSPDKQGLLSLALHERNNSTIDMAFYKKWLSASYFLSRIILNASFALKLNVVHDTTLSGSFALKNLEAAHGRGYHLVVLMQGASAKTREESAEKRSETFFQSLPDNMSALDNLFAEKIPEIVDLCDEVFVAWRDAANDDSKRVAIILDNKVLAVIDHKGFDKFCIAYPAMRTVAEKLERRGASEIRSQVSSRINERAMGQVRYPKHALTTFSLA